MVAQNKAGNNLGFFSSHSILENISVGILDTLKLNISDGSRNFSETPDFCCF